MIQIDMILNFILKNTASSTAISQKGFMDILTLFNSTPLLLVATRTCSEKKGCWGND